MFLKNNVIVLINSLALLFIVTIVGCGGGDSNSSSSSPSNSVGKGGSMARFSIIDNYLYTISGSNLQLFSFAPDFSSLLIDAKVPVGWNIETLYSANNYLFIGASDGVYIFDNSDPANPTRLSKFQHVQACDPVVVDGNFAYVTLRSGSGGCRFGANSLDVVDISNIKDPKFVKSYTMQNPKGLGVANGVLFVCDGRAGLKIFDLNSTTKAPGIPSYLTTDTRFNCYDLIANKNSLVISDISGLLQYGYDNTSNSLNIISEILKVSANTPK